MSWMFWLACAPVEVPEGDSAHVDIPDHNACLPVGERYTDDVCLAVVEDQGRVATESRLKAPVEATADDPRLVDPEFLWVTGEVDRCVCRCCHTTGLGGAGVHAWDRVYSPVWVDSASDWSLRVFGGYTDEYAQTLPTDDVDRLRAWIEGEWARRDALGG